MRESVSRQSARSSEAVPPVALVPRDCSHSRCCHLLSPGGVNYISTCTMLSPGGVNYTSMGIVRIVLSKDFFIS